jgi:hypothetical protein
LRKEGEFVEGVDGMRGSCRYCCKERFGFNVQSSYLAQMNKKVNKVSLREYAIKHNPKLNRRGKSMSEGYLYRLIREDIKGVNTRDLWFKYELTGEKDRIYIHLS